MSYDSSEFTIGHDQSWRAPDRRKRRKTSIPSRATEGHSYQLEAVPRGATAASLEEDLHAAAAVLELSSCLPAGASYSPGGAADMEHASAAVPLASRRAAAGAPRPGRRTVVTHRRKARHDLAGPCNHCGALTSPQWRKGPKGKPVLCNACGIRFLRNRTLTKMLPKKRRQPGGGTGGSKRSRAASPATTEAEEEEEDDDDDGDAFMAVAGAFVAAGEAAGAAEQHMGCFGMSQHTFLHQQQQQHLAAFGGHHHHLLQEQQLHAAAGSLAAVAAAAAAAAAGGGFLLRGAAVDDCGCDGDDGDDADEPGDAGHQSSSQDQLSDSTAPALFMPPPPLAVGAAAAAAAAAGAEAAASSRQLLMRARGGRDLLTQLGDCPTLAIALARHQQQQRRRRQQQGGQQQQQPQQHLLLPAHQDEHAQLLPGAPQLQLLTPGSPQSDSAATGYAGTAGATAAAAISAGAAALAVSSPLSSISQPSQHACGHRRSSGTPPLSPLLLGLTGGGSGGGGGAAAPRGSASGECLRGPAAPHQPADILQLVQQLGASLGGVGPAVEFLKLCSGSPAAVSAALAAVACAGGAHLGA